MLMPEMIGIFFMFFLAGLLVGAMAA